MRRAGKATTMIMTRMRGAAPPRAIHRSYADLRARSHRCVLPNFTESDERVQALEAVNNSGMPRP